MDKFIINGGRQLQGEVSIGGAKNAALPILAACLLADGESSIGNVPYLSDVSILTTILHALGMYAFREGDRIVCRVMDENNSTPPKYLVQMMRASICVLGPLVAKRGYARISLPGGCVIGTRPIDLHLKGLQALGVKISYDSGCVVAEADRLIGTRVDMCGPNGPTVLGTQTVMMAATLAEGVTIIEHAACEPEVEDLANFLVKMGAVVKGAGTSRIQVEGVSKLKGVEYDVIPDRIEAATMLIAGAVTGGDVLCRGAVSNHLGAVLCVLADAGVTVLESSAGLRVIPGSGLKGINVVARPYPEVPTDVQAMMTVLMCVADGSSTVTDNVFPDRFAHVDELKKMGARIVRDGNHIKVTGVAGLKGADVVSTDLRASAALVIAALVADGNSVVSDIYHLDRGYDRLEIKLQMLGANIKRMED